MKSGKISIIKTTVLQFILEAPRKCTILCFLLANCYGINYCNFFIGQYNQNERNVVNSTQLTMFCLTALMLRKAQANRNEG